MKTWPDSVAPYDRTRVFTEATVPAGLLRAHTTKAGVWGRIVVLEGALLYRVLEPKSAETLLEPGLDGIVEPEVRHEVEPRGPVRFFVEFGR